jgi:hypothetical protein
MHKHRIIAPPLASRTRAFNFFAGFSLSVGLLCLVLSFSACSSMRLYDRNAGEKAAADSIRTADSLRAADSLRVKDSLILLKYEVAGDRAKKQRTADSLRVIRAREIMAEMAADTAGYDSSGAHRPVEETFEARAIVVDPEHPLAGAIDSLGRVIAACEDSLYADKAFAKTRNYCTKDKMRYMLHLIRYGKKDTSEVERFGGVLLDIDQLLHRKLGLILETQEDADRQFVSMHMKSLQTDMQTLSDFLFGFSSRSTFVLERVRFDSDSTGPGAVPDSLITSQQ